VRNVTGVQTCALPICQKLLMIRNARIIVIGSMMIPPMIIGGIIIVPITIILAFLIISNFWPSNDGMELATEENDAEESQNEEERSEERRVGKERRKEK